MLYISYTVSFISLTLQQFYITIFSLYGLDYSTNLFSM